MAAPRIQLLPFSSPVFSCLESNEGKTNLKKQRIDRTDPRDPPLANGQHGGKHRDRNAYVPPPASAIKILSLSELLAGHRPISTHMQSSLPFDKGRDGGLKLWCVGETSLIHRTCVAVVGTRKVSDKGASRAYRIARELAEQGVVVVSGLAEGVDTIALTSAIKAGGNVIAVIGTPVDKAYPAANKRLQEEIYRDHLLISQFEPGRATFPSNFPKRNKLMATISDATVIVEASDTSGALHQAQKCMTLNRWLFIANSIMEDRSLRWTTYFRDKPNVLPLTSVSDILRVLRPEQAATRPRLRESPRSLF